MARVNLDGKVWTDPRVKRLAKRRGITMRETVGTLAAVWTVAYDTKSAVMPVVDVDTAAELDGFAHDMVTESLAQYVDGEHIAIEPRPDVRLRGVTERIQYLLSQAALGRLGGQKRVTEAKRDAKGRLVSASKPSPGVRLADTSTKGSPALPLDLDLPLSPDPDHDPDQDTERVAPAGAPDALRLAGVLHDLIAARQPTGQTARRTPEARRKVVARWAVDIDKLNRIDRIDWSDIEKAIRYAQGSDFWAPNILSGSKLREKYETLHGQSRRAGASAGAKTGRIEPHTAEAYADGEVTL